MRILLLIFSLCCSSILAAAIWSEETKVKLVFVQLKSVTASTDISLLQLDLKKNEMIPYNPIATSQKLAAFEPLFVYFLVSIQINSTLNLLIE